MSSAPASAISKISANFHYSLAKKGNLDISARVRLTLLVMKTEPLTLDMVKRIASEADVDVRTIFQKMAGLTVRGRAGNRIDRAIERLGLIITPAEIRQQSVRVGE